MHHATAVEKERAAHARVGYDGIVRKQAVVDHENGTARHARDATGELEHTIAYEAGAFDHRDRIGRKEPVRVVGRVVVLHHAVPHHKAGPRYKLAQAAGV